MSHEYFTAQTTSLTVPKSGAFAIYAGDAPRKNDDGTTSMHLSAPLLIIPSLWADEQAIAEKVAKVLNENAHLFFDSARIEP